ncbi:MAG TPA: GNAT family N-acetyltransferase [Thermoleophilia bacterium]|nr:GNAT family N-acetyltransferase [Thermoleophilia bacterium]
MTTPCFVVRGVHHEYRAGSPALAGIDLAVQPGEHVAVVGANGSGKSTLLKMLDGLVFPTAGEVAAFGEPLTEDALEDPAFRRGFRARVGFVFQEADVQLFCSDVRDELAFGPLQLGLAEDEVRRRVDHVAGHLRIDRLLDRPPYSLSGGEKKRVAIASVITMQPQVLLLDEPTNALDPRSQVWLLEVLDEWKREGRTVVMATHDLSAAAEAADRLVVLSEEHTVVADGAPNEVLALRDLLLSVNLVHEHAHHHGVLTHTHLHAHPSEHEDDAGDRPEDRREHADVAVADRIGGTESTGRASVTPDTQVAVRLARMDDAPALAALAGVMGYEVTPDEARARLERQSPDPETAVFVAELDGRVVGYVQAVERRILVVDPFVELGGLAVSPDARRGGVASRLLAAVEEWAAARDVRLVRVRSRRERSDAHEAYRACGFGLDKEQLVFSKRIEQGAG